MESFWSPESVDWLKLRTFLMWTEACTIYQWRFVLPIPIARLTCPNTIADYPTSGLSPGHSHLDSDLAFQKVVAAPSAPGKRLILDLNRLLAFTSSTLVFAIVIWLAPANVNHRGHCP